MQTTERYGLKLPEGSDRLRVEPINENTQKLEELLLGLRQVGGLVVEKIQTSRTWTVPRALGQVFQLFVVGGGGGGGAYTGAGSGYMEMRTVQLEQGEEIEVVCGAGGTGGKAGTTTLAPTEGGETSFGSYATAGGGEPGSNTQFGANGGNGGAGGGGGMSNSNNTSENGSGGNGQYGGGGGAGKPYTVGKATGTGGTGGIYGGAGGCHGGSPENGTPYSGPWLRLMFRTDLPMDGTAGTGYGPGSGGVGGRGGSSVATNLGASSLVAGAGGGGFCSNGGTTGSNPAYGGGGGGYCGDGGNGNTNSAGGGGGGGFFCRGGHGAGSGGGGGGFFSDGGDGSQIGSGTSSLRTGGNGGNGGVLILYFVEDGQTDDRLPQPEETWPEIPNPDGPGGQWEETT